MKRITSLVLLGATLTFGESAAVAAKAPTKPFPVVATYFSNLFPRVGQHETITVQFYLASPKSRKVTYLSGGHFSATLAQGKHFLLTVKGTTTDAHGKAFAHFTIPGKARGQWLIANASVSYQGKLYRGNNRVKVAKS